MRGGPSFYVEHRLKQLSGLGDYPEECRKRRLRDILGRSWRRYSEGTQESSSI